MVSNTTSVTVNVYVFCIAFGVYRINTVHLTPTDDVFYGDYFCVVLSHYVSLVESDIKLCQFLRIFLHTFPPCVRPVCLLSKFFHFILLLLASLLLSVA